MAQITILNQANVPQGPFTREEVAQKLAGGEFTLDSLAFIEGLTQWTPLGAVLAKVDVALAPPPVVPTPTSIPPANAPAGAYSYAATMQPPGHFVYAGFWLRVVAILVDGVIFLPLSGISYYLQYLSRTSDFDSAAAKIGLGLFMIAYGIFLIIARWLYFALMESSGWQATVGKKMIGLKVTTLDGQRIGFGRATGRYFGKIVSALILGIGFLMAGWTERKQALHDMMAGTLVIRG
jgi:uncharacterized RDD family membrane protein YckC